MIALMLDVMCYLEASLELYRDALRTTTLGKLNRMSHVLETSSIDSWPSLTSYILKPEQAAPYAATFIIIMADETDFKIKGAASKSSPQVCW